MVSLTVHAYDGSQDRSPWPAPPYDWPHVAPPKAGGPQACRIEMKDGSPREVFVTDIDPEAAHWHIGSHPCGPHEAVPLAHLRRVTVSTPLRASLRSLSLGPASLPIASQQRAYKAFSTGGEVLFRGNTVGFVQRDCGTFLFSADPENQTLRRLFVPRGGVHRIEFGPTMRESAAERWITSVDELWSEVDGQFGRPVPRLGQVLLRLGLVTPSALDNALGRLRDRRALGRRLMDDGVIDDEALRTAIAVKMGFPLVDLRRFPVDPTCARALSLDASFRHHAIAIARKDRRIVVAMDRTDRIAALEAARLLSGDTIVPAIAPAGAIRLALVANQATDVWGDQRRRANE